MALEDESGAAAEAEPTWIEVADRAARRITTGLLLAGAAIGLAIYARPAPQRFEAVAVGDTIVRIDTRKGTMIACDEGRCATILKSGQKLERNPGHGLLPSPPAPVVPVAAPKAP